MRKADKERVARYREAYPFDKRSDEDILKRIQQVMSDQRHGPIMIDWATHLDPFSEDELRRGRLDVQTHFPEDALIQIGRTSSTEDEDEIQVEIIRQDGTHIRLALSREAYADVLTGSAKVVCRVVRWVK